MSILVRLISIDRYSCVLCSSDKYEEHRRHWGGGLRGNKSAQMMRKRAKAAGQTLSAANAAKL